MKSLLLSIQTSLLDSVVLGVVQTFDTTVQCIKNYSVQSFVY